MTKWMCSECGYQMDAQTPPKPCPSCKKDCMFADVTCYIPDCGGEKNVNPQIADTVRKQKKPEKKA
ncbi:MAG: hypothetical protein WC749_17390 [Dehalococcoidia bacterium]